MPFITVNLDFSKHSDPLLLTDSQGILDSMTGNLGFPNPTPTLANFTTNINGFLLAMAEAQSRDTTLIAIRNEKRAILEADLFQLGTYVNLTAMGDIPMLVSSGFKLKKPGNPTPPIAQPQDLRIDNGPNSGEVFTSVKAVKGAKSYMHQFTKGPLTESSVWESMPCTRRKCLITNLHPGDTVWFRVAAVGVRDQIVYSDAIARIIQ